MSQVRVERIYTPASPEHGNRVLVDRLWPRGIRKDAAALDEWLPAVAPSDELRTWFGHDPERFDEFAQRYRQELTDPQRQAALDELRGRAEAGTLTLLTATRDPSISHLAVLADILTAGH